MKKIELEIVALSHSVTNSTNYAILLEEIDGSRRLPIVIGAYEAQAIAIAMENMVPNRPLTHDLFKSTLDTFGIVLKEIVINNLMDGVFHARLVCEQNGQIIEIDSRSSDALAMAVRFKCPIYTFEFILEEAGVALPGEIEEDNAPVKKVKASKKSDQDNLNNLTNEELHSMLNEVLNNENYERAALIRDEIKRRQDQG